MDIEVKRISGIREYTEETEGGLSKKCVQGRVFCVMRGNTLEVRTDKNLAKMLIEKYERVMESRYFGKGGVEIVLSGQIGKSEVEDLVRLSYNLTKEMGK